MSMDIQVRRTRDARPRRLPAGGEREEASLRPGDVGTAAKHALDFGVGLALLVLTGPVMVVLAALVRLTSRGPAIYSQTRVGCGGEPFTIYKLRTMRHNCESASGPRWCVPGDSRVTWLGAVLRRTHLDELPQLWNVLRGEMSLVGPRPERPEFVSKLEQLVPHYRDRLLVRPGVTGLAQIRLPADTDVDSVRRKLAYDLYYLRHRSFWLDFKIIVCTACKCLSVPLGWPQWLLRVPECHAVRPVHAELVPES
jgi:lipopolysaccharide/colanic/teichoic acid biosynthesis glycosyltransferase